MVAVCMNGKVAEEYRIVDVNERNIDTEGLLCFKSKKKTEGYKKKIEWIRNRFKEGLRAKLLLVNEGEKRGLTARGFIEYMPGESAWRGIDANGYMVIHCIWVVGQHKGRGYGSKLLKQCLHDAKGMSGVAVVTGRTWLPRAALFVKHGFEKADSMPPEFELYAKRFSDKVPFPKFNLTPSGRFRKYGRGITVFRSDQCPYTIDSVNAITETALQLGIPIRTERIESCKEAQHGVHPYGTFCVLLNGKVLTYRPIGKRGLLESLAKTRA